MLDLNLIKILPKQFLDELDKYNDSKINEIRVRVNRQIVIKTNTGQHKLDTIVLKGEIDSILDCATGHSMYAYDEALRQGYITIKGGHRIGICGKGVIENEKIKILKQISSLNIRIANECIGCSDNIMSKIYKNKSVDHTLIISPPYAGKTTMLRDILRRIAMDYNVGIVDERGEIAATYMGVIQNDLGENVDVLDNCPKAEGIPILVRTMAPDVIGIDEIGGKQDIEALIYSINCGCKIYATIHGTSIEDVRKKPYINKLIDDKIFKYYIVLSYNGKTRKEEVYEV